MFVFLTLRSGARDFFPTNNFLVPSFVGDVLMFVLFFVCGGVPIFFSGPRSLVSPLLVWVLCGDFLSNYGIQR